MNAASPDFFICSLLGGLVLYGLAPQLGAFALALAGLWILGKSPIIFFGLMGAWLLWKPLRWVLDFFIGGFAAGLGFGAATRRRRISTTGDNTRLPIRRPRAERFRRPPIGYYNGGDFDDDMPSNLP
jgi:hypothetical protein